MNTAFEAGTPSQEGSVPLCVPEIRGDEWTYIKECLDTTWTPSEGAYVDRFEAGLVDFVGAPHAMAWPVFIDSEPETWQMDPQQVIDFLDNE